MRRRLPASVIKNNEARPVRRAFHWYGQFGASKKLARGHRQTRQELTRAGQALESGKLRLDSDQVRRPGY